MMRRSCELVRAEQLDSEVVVFPLADFACMLKAAPTKGPPALTGVPRVSKLHGFIMACCLQTN